MVNCYDLGMIGSWIITVHGIIRNKSHPNLSNIPIVFTSKVGATLKLC